MTLHRPALRLALWYELIVVCVSLAFSAAIYRITVTQIENSLRQQYSIFQQRRPDVFAFPFRSFEDELVSAQLQDIRRRIIVTLAIVNGAIIIAAGGVSYALARRTLKPIEENLEQQRRFTADASHELRTPLAAMQAEIEVALRNASAKPGEHADVLRSNLEEIHRLEQLSRGLLKLAQAEAHERPLTLEAVPVSAFVDDAIRHVQPKADAKHITVARTDLSGSVQGNHQSLVELLGILLDNAVKYSDAGTSVRVAVELGNRTVTLRVQDHGVGIKASDLPHIFDRFYRADAARTKTTVDGYGLGLPIAKQIVERHHGKLTVASTLGEGSTFSVVLPRAKS